MAMKKPIRILATIAAVMACLLFSCEEIWGKLDNPSDPEGSKYQGYETVESPDDISAIYPVADGELSGMEMMVNRVAGSTIYAVRIASSEAGLDASPIYERSDFTANDMKISDSSLADRTRYFWQARARASSSSTWGAWTKAIPFTVAWPVAATPAIGPKGGIYESAQSVTISSSVAGATIFYTTDGSDPENSATRISGTSPIGPIEATARPATTIRAIAVAPWHKTSAEAKEVYRELTVGDHGPAGGIIFYDKGSYSDGWRYMEAAPSDQSAGIQWNNGMHVTTGATSHGIGAGAANTKAIIAAQGEGNYAAALCDSLVVGAYTDWFLPSQSELIAMFSEIGSIGLATFTYYWSSSEEGDDVYVVVYGYGVTEMICNKNSSCRVRAARWF
jgi:hypothetical protein